MPFIGHLLTDQGLTADPENMPTPTNVKSLKDFVGMMQYLTKFIPQLSAQTEPLRELERKDVEWCWLTVHDDVIAKLKKSVCEATALKYFDSMQEVTVQSDASEKGLEYTLMQNGQPVAYGARGLTTTEKQYAQIETEMLAIVVGCEKFDQYIYGRRLRWKLTTSPCKH